MISLCFQGKWVLAKSYRLVDRDQQFLLPTDMGQWLATDHFVWFLIDVVDALDMKVFEAAGRRGGVGRQAYDPRLLLALLVYGYATGQRSSRRIEDLCHTDVAYRVLCAQDVPDHSTIARFRQTHHDAVADLFVQVLVVAGKAGLGRVGIVAIDGTKIAANASVGANRKRSWLRREVDQMMAEAARAKAQKRFDVFGARKERAEREGAPKPTGVYPESAEDYRSVDAAKKRLQDRQKRRDEAAAKAATRAGVRKDPRANTTDPDSGPMPTAKGWIQGYNAQLVVSDDQLILAAQATDTPVDCGQLTPMIEAAQTGIDALNSGRDAADHTQIGTVVADAGYLSEENLAAEGPDRLIATGKRYELEKAAQHPDHQGDAEPDSAGSSNLIEAMAKRLRTEKAMNTYRRRGITVEPVNGHLKDRIGLRQFSRRGIKAVQAELVLAATVANLLKIYRHGN